MISFKKISLFFLLSAACYFPLFLHLDSPALYGYDEARTALNSIAMLENGNPLVTFFNGEPDMWNTKPPLMNWLQVLSMKALGVNELSIRIPAAIAALFTVLFLGFYCRKHHIKIEKTVLFIIFCIALFGMPYRQILSKVYWPRHKNPMNQYGAFMKAFPEYDHYSIVNFGYNGQIIFYEKLYREKGYTVQQKYPDQLFAGEKTLICEEKVKAVIWNGFEYNTLETWESCQLLQLTARKN